jgi:hypothetical protein
VDGAVTPLFGVVSATFGRYREVESGFEIRSAELAYFTDLDSHSVLDTWKNPYTNETVPVPVSSLPPTTSRIATNLRMDSQAANTPGLQFRQNVSQPQIVGREIWFTESITAERDAGPTQAAFHYTDTTVIRARLADLDKHGATLTRCDTSYQSVSSWRTWLKMGSHPGVLIGFGNGYYGASINELPPAWIKATEKSRPRLLTDPTGILEAGDYQAR